MLHTKKTITLQKAAELTSNIHMAYYVVAADRLGFTYEVLIPGLLVEFSSGEKHWRIHKALTPINDSVAMSITSYKNICNEFLRNQGFTVPRQKLVSSADEIHSFMEEEQITHIVIKPTRGFGGIGVTIQPKTETEIRRAFRLAEKKSMSTSKNKVIVEEFISGKHYRLVVLGDTLIAASERMPPHVTGDGTHTIDELITIENNTLTQKGRSKIKLDDESDKALETQNVTLGTVLKKDTTVIVRFNANMTSGGSTRECLDEVDPVYRTTAISIAQTTGLRLAGIDLITPNIADPEGTFAINEVNHNPGLRIHYLPDYGKPVDIAKIILQYIKSNI